MASHKELRELMLFAMQTTCYRLKSFSFCRKYLHATTATTTLFQYSHVSTFYYIDRSVLLENIPLVKFMKTTSGTRVVYFP